MERINNLVTVTSKQMLNDLRGMKNITLLYPLKSFCVGYNVTFDITEIDDFVLINRILDDADLDKLESILNNSKIKGIVFDDLGIIEVIKNKNITKILLLDHIATNSISINYYLEYVDSVVVSNDLTESEIRDIVNNSKKPLVVNVFGLKTLMYSRRQLLTNYALYHGLDKETYLEASIDGNQFRIVENEYGTVFYAKDYYDAFSLLDLKNVCYFWYNPILLDSDILREVMMSGNASSVASKRYFLDKKTYYKVGDENA